MSPSPKRAGLKNGAPALRGSIRNSIEGVEGLDGLVIFLLYKGILLGGTVKAPRAEDLRQGHCRGREVAEAEVEAAPFRVCAARNASLTSCRAMASVSC